MTARPIIFSGEMVRALLADKKTMTRRVARSGAPYASPWRQIMPGDLLWVRESWAFGHDGMRFMATDKEKVGHLTKWRPSIHLKRTDSRITLVVFDIKIEPLQNITEYDAGLEGMPEPYMGDGDPPFEESAMLISRKQQFRNLWNKLHGGYAWDQNPEVVAISFTVHRRNVDTF